MKQILSIRKSVFTITLGDTATDKQRIQHSLTAFSSYDSVGSEIQTGNVWNVPGDENPNVNQRPIINIPRDTAFLLLYSTTEDNITAY